MTTRIAFTGVEASGRHGVSEAERATEQAFVIDAELDVDVTADTVDGTLDYVKAVMTVRRVVAARSFQLIETLAAELARELCELGAVRARVKVSKPRVAAKLGVADVSATAEA